MSAIDLLSVLSPLQHEGSEWTAREIAQQPAIWQAAAEGIAAHRSDVDAFLAPLLQRENLRIVLTGAGTSAFVGEVLAPALSRVLGRDVLAIATTDIVSNPREAFPAGDQPTLLVSFARSGSSPESTAALVLADQVLDECHHLVLTCNPNGTLYRERYTADRSLALLMPEGSNDRGFAMTSSFTSMLLSGWLAFAPCPAELVTRLATAGEQLAVAASPVLEERAATGYQRVVYLGSGPLTGLARESALKMLELTAGGVVAVHDSSLGFRHGPKSILDDRTLVVIFVSSYPYTRQYDLDIVREVRRSVPERDVLTVSAGDEPNLATENDWHVTGVDDADDALLALPFILLAQLLALHTSVRLGRTPDNPFPTGKVNRVVQGVTIHPLPGEPSRPTPA
jgi:tagatose-6-phosphate ketose/aldose isomerase